MPSSLTRLLAGAAAAVLPLAAPAVVHAEAYRFHYDHVLGTSLDVTAVAADEAAALMAVTAVRQEIARLDKVLSAWRPDSELEGLNRSGSVKASADLHAVLAGCEGWRRQTNGAFDCRMGEPLARLRRGAPGAAFAQALADARRELRIGADRTVHRPDGVRLTVDGMAKGYVIDRAVTAARKASPGLKGLMVDIGGDLRCWGQAPGAAGWRVGVAACGEADNQASAVLDLGERALAVSGRGPRDLTVEGLPASHTLDPATGRPAAHVRSAAVVARTAADADALATAFMVMKPDRALALAARTPGAEALITLHDGTRRPSAGWPAVEAPMLVRASYAATAIAAAAPAAGAGRALTLDMTYTVPRLDAEPYHAPYVVAWITDANRQMVRTLLLLGPKPKWAPENFVWWRRYGRQTPQVIETVGRPTRLPGKYSLHWDGKDETGKPAAPGAYILHIESAREKGGHTYQTVDLDLAAGGAKALPAKDEMGAVEVKFGPA